MSLFCHLCTLVSKKERLVFIQTPFFSRMKRWFHSCFLATALAFEQFLEVHWVAGHMGQASGITIDCSLSKTECKHLNIVPSSRIGNRMEHLDLKIFEEKTITLPFGFLFGRF